MLAGTARFCFNLFGFFFADSACTAIGLPSASKISGCLPSVTHSLVTTTFFACSKDGTLSIQKTGSPCECLQKLPVFVSICLDLLCRFCLHGNRLALCIQNFRLLALCHTFLGHNDFFRLFQRRYAMHQYFPYRKQAAPAMCCKNCPFLF